MEIIDLCSDGEDDTKSPSDGAGIADSDEVISPPCGFLPDAGGMARSASPCDLDREFAPQIAQLLATPPLQPAQEYYDELIQSKKHDGVTVNYAGEHGKGVFANKDFDEGDLILKDKILVGAQHSLNKIDCVVCSYCFRFIGSIEFQIGHRLYLQSIDCNSERHCHGSESGSSTGSPGVTKENSDALPQEVLESLLNGEISLPFSDHFSLPEVVACHGCMEERYCSQSCADSDWESYHSLLCAGSNTEPSQGSALQNFIEHANGTNDIFLVAAKAITFTLLRYKKLKRQHDFQNKSAGSNFSLLMEAFKPLSMGFKKRWWDYIAWPEDIDASYVDSFRQERRNLAFTSLQLLKDVIFDAECAPLFSLEVYGHIIGMFELNNLDLVVASPVDDYFIHIDDLPDDKKEEAEKVTKPFLDALDDDYAVPCDGTAFFPLQSCMNHSCCPNAKAFKRDEDNDGHAVIIALGPISRGDEITISYIDEDLPYEERQAELVDYGFTCTCSKCQEEDDTKSPSDGAGITLLGLDKKHNLGSDGVNRSLVLFNTPLVQNKGKQPINLSSSSSSRSPAVSSQRRIYPLPSSSVMLHGSTYSSSLKVLSENDDDDIYMYSVPPKSFPTSHSLFVPPKSFPNSHSLLNGIVVKDDLTAKFDYFGTSAANEIGVSSSTMSADWKLPSGSSQKVETDETVCDNDDVGPRSDRMFPPSRSSWNSVDGAEVNGFGTQGHPNVEHRPSGCDERAIYEEALQHISQETREEDLPEGVMSISLMKHQKIALAWMLSKENSSHCPGGILADDQGLGKTISTISLIQKERVQQSNFMSADSDRLASNLELCAQSGTAVDRIVKPVKVEPKKKTRVRLPSSASTSRSATRPSAGTLVVCPTTILKQWASEISAKVTESSKLSVLVYHGGSRTTDPTELAKYDVVVTTYGIVGKEVPKQDSNDDMEQKNCEKSGICPDFGAGNNRKLQKGNKKKASKKNKLNSSDADLEGGPLARVQWFRVVLDEAHKIKNHRTESARGCCGLRAKRRWCLSGTPMQNKIDDLYSYFRFLKYEPYSDYGSFQSMIKKPISGGSSQGLKKLQTVLKIVLLRRTKETQLDGEPIIKIPSKTIKLEKINFTQEERYFYLALEEGSRQKFKKFAAAGTINQNYANILVLLLRLRQACDHPFLLKEDNHANLTKPASIEMAKQLPREIVINLLEKLEERHLVCFTCAEPPENAVITTCCHVFCYECVLESLSEQEVCPVCKHKLSAESVFSRPVLRLCLSDELQSYATTSSSPAAADESSAAADEADESSAICEKTYVSSKVQAAVDTLNAIIESSPSQIAPSKAIVFSQWTGMLDVLELSLNKNLIKFRRLDGSMTLAVRGAAVEEFKTDPEVRVMLMSLNAGNLGLNMIAASHVIMLDPSWNPYSEDQAVDRAHRIGQTRPVTVTRFTVDGTVEDRVLALQAKKREMVESAFGDDMSGIAPRFTEEDLGHLFNI